MSTLRIGIVEDEMIIADTISLMLQELGYNVCWHAARYGEAVNLLDQEVPDFLLLDIQLSGKLDGIDLAQLVQAQYAIPYIFITANADVNTIERAKLVKPMAYLTKPITKNLLFTAIEIAINNFTQIPAPSITPTKQQQVRDALFVKDGNAYRKVHFSDILFLQSEGNYVHIKLTDGKQVLVRVTLPEILDQLNPETFLRVHRSYAVHTKYVDRVLADEIKLAGQTIPLAKTYRESLFQVLGIT